MEAARAGDSICNKAILDVELFVCVARSLVRGELSEGLPDNTSKKYLLSLIHGGGTANVEIFSAKREVDFSQLKPRGHYTKSKKLARYVRAMIWLGTVDFRVAGGENQAADLYQLHCAVLLVHFLQNSQSLEFVDSVDSIVSSLVADGGIGADSLSPIQISWLLPPKDILLIRDNDQLLKMMNDLQSQVFQKGLGVQLINGHPRVVHQPLTSSTTYLVDTDARPPRFALLGQRFVWSSFIFSRLVFDQVLYQNEKQKRRIPSAVDVAFTLFGNNSAARVLADRMNMDPPKLSVFGTPQFVPFRDGIQFSPNLVALRQCMESGV